MNFIIVVDFLNLSVYLMNTWKHTFLDTKISDSFLYARNINCVMREQTEDRTIKPLYLKDSEIQYSDNGKKRTMSSRTES